MKIRKVLTELKQKREEQRRIGEKGTDGRGRRSRSRSGGRASKRDGGGGSAVDPMVEEYFNYSSRRLGTGAHCPDSTDMRFSSIAMMANNEVGNP